jgi:hypothetical protein
VEIREPGAKFEKLGLIILGDLGFGLKISLSDKISLKR